MRQIVVHQMRLHGVRIRRYAIIGYTLHKSVRDAVMLDIAKT